MAMASARSRSGSGRWLSRPWWAGLGVILATAVALAGIFLTSNSSPSYSNNGSCVAQGNNNTVSCPSAGSGAGP
jgi:hypothetical protein